MRELKVVGLDPDGKYLICEGDEPAEKFRISADGRLRDALRREPAPAEQPQQGFEHPQLATEIGNRLSPKEIQAKIRAGASIEQVAAACGSDISRIRRFAQTVLLERYRAAELATAAHPMLPDGPAVLTLQETVSAALVARGFGHDILNWDAWRNGDARWTVQLTWKAGHSDNVAHFCFRPGHNGGTVTAIDDAASELIDPNFERPLRPLARVAHVEFKDVDEPAKPAAPEPVRPAAPAPRKPTAAAKQEQPAPTRKGKPAIPAWEDVLLGVRTGGQG